MYILFLPFMLLPFLEIYGFVQIGGKIGFGPGFLWLIGATVLGLYILRARGEGSWSRIKTHTSDVFVVSDLFDGICINIGAILLIFPGFISDFIAVPFLIAPLRHWMFTHIRNNPDSFVRRHARPGTFRDEQPENRVIDGEYKKIDNNDHLSSS